MSARRLLTITAAGALVIALVLILLFALPDEAPQPFTLPDKPVSPSAAFGNDNVEGISRVTLNIDTVREVVATLSRPEAYSRDLMIESFWDGGNAVYNFSVSVADGMTAARMSYGGIQKTIIIRDGNAYIRYGFYEPFAVIPLDTPNAADEYQMIPTYEDVIALDRDDIMVAELRNSASGEPLVFVRWKSGELGYITDATVSVRLGLLIRAETRDGDTVVGRMTAGECDLSVPDASVFSVG